MKPVSLTPLTLHAAMLALLALLAAGTSLADGPRRVVAAGGSAAEIVHALGLGDRLVARDTTSVYPPEVTDLPDVGYVRRLSPENLIALSPDLILAEHDAGPPETLDLLRAAGVAVVTLAQGLDPASLAAKITATADALGAPGKAGPLIAQVTADLEAAQAAAAALPRRPRVLFVLSVQAGRVLAAGQGTSADAMIRLAGGDNAVAGFTGYKPVTDEAILTAAPDAILMMDRTGDRAADLALVRAHPALSATPAAAAGHVIRMDGLYLLGFGPRTGLALRDLSEAFAAVVGPVNGG